jgi:uncharacterized protein YndB with AHSA1/START domain
MPPGTQESMNAESTTTKVFEVYIKAPAATIWDAITSPEWTRQYGYQASSEYELRAGGAFRCRATAEMQQFGLPEIIIDGEVIEASPPNKLVQTYRFMFNEATKAEGFTRITWEIESTVRGYCRLTVIHEVEGAPLAASMIVNKYSEPGGGGWSWILSDLKSLLETGKTMAA